MKVGRTYEVFVYGKPVGLIGSTVNTLTRRRTQGYTRRFGRGVELHLIREVPRHESEDDVSYNFHLKAAEALDIARKKTYTENGGLNKFSPLIQVMWHPLLEIEIGRIGGLKTKADRTGIFAPEMLGVGGKIGGSIGARKRNKLYGNPATPESCAKGGRIGILKLTHEARSRGGCKGGQASASVRKRAKTGIFAPGMSAQGNKIGNCQRWNVSRGKVCICGKHPDFRLQDRGKICQLFPV